jgi:hypothetical protein
MMTPKEQYDEITNELSAVTHGLLDIIRGPDRTETIERVQRAHKLLLRLHSLAFPVPPARELTREEDDLVRAALTADKHGE